MEFKNEAVKDIVEVMEKHMATFEARRSGAMWRNILVAVSNVFTEDRNKIFMRFGGRTAVAPTSGQEPRITRGAKTKRASGGDCEGCPKNAVTPGQPSGAKVRTPGKPDDPFSSVDDILDRFAHNANAIRAFAQVKNISIPANVKKTSTIARYLLEGLTKDEEE